MGFRAAGKDAGRSRRPPFRGLPSWQRRFVSAAGNDPADARSFACMFEHDFSMPGHWLVDCKCTRVSAAASGYDHDRSASDRVIDQICKTPAARLRWHRLGRRGKMPALQPCTTMAKKLSDLVLQQKRVLVRVDFNVPLDDHGQVTSDARIRESLPTIRAILAAGGMPILMSHLGRPKGKVVESMRMTPVGRRLQQLLGSPVQTVGDCIGPAAEQAARALRPGECLLLENLRFHAAEEDGDPAFAAALARLGDAYVNDAFGSAHRAHASVSGVPQLLPAAAGLLLQKELDAFARVLHDPAHPFVAILGGAKVSDKLPVIEHLLPKIDQLLIGGAMAYTFLQQQGHKVGKSLVENDLLAEAGRVLAQAGKAGKQLLLPVDHVCAAELEADSKPVLCTGDIAADLMGLDIGPQTIAAYTAALQGAKTIVWNGPMGVFEFDAFGKGTEAIARAIAGGKAFSVVG
ncbi:MAG TPA: phosphoglycerate kinase, partial [Planctomycetota bacterium]|nr:phosphoglycerate kinase [Planctomycetota bacterium]